MSAAVIINDPTSSVQQPLCGDAASQNLRQILKAVGEPSLLCMPPPDQPEKLPEPSRPLDQETLGAGEHHAIMTGLPTVTAKPSTKDSETNKVDDPPAVKGADAAMGTEPEYSTDKQTSSDASVGTAPADAPADTTAITVEKPAKPSGDVTTSKEDSTLSQKGKEKEISPELGYKHDQVKVGDEGQSDQMESSVATLKPTKNPFLTIETPPYVDPTPPTPHGSHPPSRTSSNYRSKGHGGDPSPTRSDAGYDEHREISEDEQDGNSRSEIQSIMEQFPEEGGGPDVEEVMSPRLEIASPFLTSPPSQHPPRKSSLEPLAPNIAQQIEELKNLRMSSSSPVSLRSTRKESELDDQGPPVPPKDGPSSEQGPTDGEQPPSQTIHRPPPPEPEPEPALPFDFHRFLEQLKNKKADPVARYLKSFLSEFAKRQWMVHEQVKIISDFLAFIANKMAQCEVWRDVSDAEFDNAREGMEKLVMNRLYSQTFSPAIPAPQPIPGAKSKRKGAERLMGPGRRGQHQEDCERDDILAQKINIYGWVREEHLDIPPVSDSGKRFLNLAQQELLKIRSYRAPRDKIICVLNCCKVIFGLLKNAKSDTSADSFMPLLIYTVLQSNPDHIVSNVQYILRFRNQDKLGGEAGYYLSSLLGVIQFVENMDRTTLTITDEEFEKNVEAAVSAIAEKHRAEETSPRQEMPALSEKQGLHPPQQGEAAAGQSSVHSAPGTPRRSISSDAADDNAVSGLLRSIQRPLSTIGRIFSEDPSQPNASSPARTPQPSGTPRPSTDGAARQQLSAEEAAARQASAEVAEAQRLHRAEHNNVVETLAGMFPDLDRDIISDVVIQKEGRVGLAVDACLALSS